MIALLQTTGAGSAGDVSFTGAEIALIAALLSAIAGTVAILYRRLETAHTEALELKDALILRLEHQVSSLDLLLKDAVTMRTSETERLIVIVRDAVQGNTSELVRLREQTSEEHHAMVEALGRMADGRRAAVSRRKEPGA